MFSSYIKLLWIVIRQWRPGSRLLFGLTLLTLLYIHAQPTASQTDTITIQTDTTANKSTAEKHYIYVGVDGGIKVYDIGQGHKFVKTISIPNLRNVRGMQAHSATRRLYVSYIQGFQDGTGLLALDLVTNKVVWHKHFSPFTDALSTTTDGKKIFMSSGEVGTADYFFVVEAATGRLLDKIHIYKGTHNNIVSLNGAHVYLASVAYNYLTMVDTKTDKILKKIGPFTEPIRPFTINGRETLVFANVEHLQGFEVASITTGKKLYRVPVKGFPYTSKGEVISHGIALSPDEKELWVAGATRYVHVFDATQMPPKQIASVPLTYGSGWINFSIDGRYVYPGSGDVIEARTRKKVGTIASSKRFLEIDFANGVPIRDGDIYGVGRVTTSTIKLYSPPL